MPDKQPEIALSPKVSDEIRKTTCYMCACRCGIDVHMRDEKVRYIEGNRDHPVNRGVLCAKGSAGIMQHYSPARLKKPLLRDGERGCGKFKEIEWEEALDLATQWLKPIREENPSKLAFFTGRDQSQSFTSFWAQQFGTPNYAAHGGFCSVNMAAAGIYTIGGSFWEFGAPDWDKTEYFMIFGVAEDHDSNPIKIGLSKLKKRGVTITAVNPVRTGYNAIADQWVGITPGTDGLFIMALIQTLFAKGKIDLAYLTRYTNAPYLVYQTGEQEGLFVRDEKGRILVAQSDNTLVAYEEATNCLALQGSFKTKDGAIARPVFALLAEHCLSSDYTVERAAEKCGIDATQIYQIADELAKAAFDQEIILKKNWVDWKGQKHDTMIGRPVSFHAMRGISAHSNGFQTCRALHILQLILGSVDTPGGFRFKPPYPKSVDSHPKPHGKSVAGKPLQGPHLGYPRGPEDLLIDFHGKALRIDKAFTWDAPLSAHGMMHMVISNACAQDPYPIDVLFFYMANMSWNSSMNTEKTMGMLTAKDMDGNYKIPKIIYSDAYSSEMVAYADLILPDTTYLERHDCISLLDRPIGEPGIIADAIRWPVCKPDRDVRAFQSVLIDLAVRLGLPDFVDEHGKAIYHDYADYITNREARPGIGPLAGWRGDGSEAGRGKPNPDQLKHYIANGGFWSEEIPEEAQYYKPFNKAWQDFAVSKGLVDNPSPFIFQLYVEPLAKFVRAAKGHGEQQPPERLRQRIIDCFNPFPIWYKGFEEQAIADDDFPLHAITQRPAAMYHSWGSQNPWLRQIHGDNALYVPANICKEHKLEDGDWVWLSSHHSRIRVPIRKMNALNARTVWTWNAIGKRKGSWGLREGATETTKGFLLNHLISELLPEKDDGMRWANSDPITGQAAWYDLRVSIAKAPPPKNGASDPQIPAQASPVAEAPDMISYGKEWSS